MQLLKNYKTIILFSDPVCADAIAKSKQTNKHLIISFSIEGKLALEKKGIKCLFPDDTIKLPDLNQVGIDNLDRVKNICNFLDMKLQEKIAFCLENNINLFYTGFYKLKLFFDSLFTSYLILEELFKVINNKEVILFKKDCPLDKIVTGQESLVPSIIENIFYKKYKNIKIVLCDTYNYKIRLKPLLKNLADNFNWPRHIFSNTIHNQYKNNGIILDYRFDVPLVVNDFLNNTNFYKIVIENNFITFKSIRTNNHSRKKIKEDLDTHEIIKKVFQEILSSMDYRNIFQCEDPLFYYANQCLEKYVIASVGNILYYGDYIKERILSLHPKIFLTASCRVGLTDAFIFEIARSLKIPIVTYQEGGGAGYINWPLFNIDSDLSDYFLVYGDGVKESPFINKDKATIVPVGSLYFEKMKQSVNKDSPSKLIIYVILDNLKTNTYQHYPYNGGLFSQAYNHQVTIINILKQFKDVRFILKTIKGREYLYDSFAEDDFIKIATTPLIKVLNNASAFILDYPSTVLQECLLTDKPIALLCSQGNVQFDQNALKSLSQRVRTSSNPSEFYDVIKALTCDALAGSRIQENNDFLNKYCLMEKSSAILETFFNKLFANQLYEN